MNMTTKHKEELREQLDNILTDQRNGFHSQSDSQEAIENLITTHTNAILQEAMGEYDRKYQDVQELAMAFVHEYYGMYTAEALTHKNFEHRAMIVVDAELLADGIARLLVAHTEDKVREARIDEHSFVAWTPNELKFIELQADRIASLENHKQEEKGDV